MRNKIIASVLIVLFALVSYSANIVRAADTTEVISGNTSAGENQPGWLFNRDLTTQTPFEFNNDQKSIGEGSLYVLPIANSINGNNDKFIAENFVNTPISNVNSISYDFMIGSGGDANDEEQFYMNVYANFGVSDDLKFYDCRYNVVPTVGSVAGFTTVTFDPTQAYPVTQRNTSPFTCPAVPADMNNSSAGSNIRAFALNLGDTSGNDQGIDGYFDKVVVNLDSGTTTYDFDPETHTVTIAKYVDGVQATAVNAENNAFPMQSSWNADNIGAGNGTYDLGPTGFNNPNPYQATTSEMTEGASYTTSEQTNGSVVGSSCQDGKPFALKGYTTSSVSLADAASKTPSLTVPNFTNLQNDAYVIVWNEDCTPAVTPSPSPSITQSPFAVPAECSQIAGLGAPIVGTSGADNINGTNGNDLIFALSGADRVDGRGGNDCIVAAGGADLVRAGNGDDVVLGGEGADDLRGENGTDFLYGEAGADLLRGGNGADTLDGGANQDSARGENGQDTCTAESENSCEL